jgi:serine/threonine protein kinase
VWSLGVLIYTMLMGAFPFDANDMSGLRKKVLAGRWDRPLAASKEANDAVRSMLVVDPRRRASLEDVMRSPWLKRVSPHFPDSFPTRPRPPTEPEADVLAWLAQRGCPLERLDGLGRQLREKDKDHLTAAYDLLSAQLHASAVAGGGAGVTPPSVTAAARPGTSLR